MSGPADISKQSKVCTKCGMEKTLTEFSPSKGGRLGVDSICRDCRRAMKRKGAVNPDTYEAAIARKRERRREAAKKKRLTEATVVPIASNHKTCTRCNLRKPTTEFSAKSSSKDRLRSWCKSCEAEADAIRHAETYTGARFQKSEVCANVASCASKSSAPCRACSHRALLSTPGFMAKIQAARQSRLDTDPVYLATVVANAAAGREKQSSNVEMAERRRESSREKANRINADPEMQRRRLDGIARYHEQRRENEAYEVFMARMEEEAEAFIGPLQPMEKAA